MTYLGNPNGARQLWSKWTFDIREFGRSPSYEEVRLNAARWLRKTFGSAGRARLSRTILGWRIECLVEGPPAHDPELVGFVRAQFQQNFVAKGWGPLGAHGDVTAKVMAGDQQDGKPRVQMIELVRQEPLLPQES